jgi:hypothetical protein
MRLVLAGGWVLTACIAGILTLNSHGPIQALALITTLTAVIQTGRWILHPPPE